MQHNCIIVHEHKVIHLKQKYNQNIHGCEGTGYAVHVYATITYVDTFCSAYSSLLTRFGGVITILNSSSED